MEAKDMEFLNAQVEVVKACNKLMDKGLKPPEVAATLMAVAVRMYHTFLTQDEFHQLMETIALETPFDDKKDIGPPPTVH